MAKSRFSRIVTPDEPDYVQGSLFAPALIQSSFPPIKHDISEILADYQDGELLGLDLEFNSKTGKPSILGIATPRVCGAVQWSITEALKIANLAAFRGARYVGHAVISADKPIWDAALGLETPLDLWEDSMIAHYLCNADFAQAPGKTEDSDDAGALGLMNLWSMASLYTELPQWKVCRGRMCSGPCPRMDVYGYCAIDSWAGLVSYLALREEMKRKGIPDELYQRLKRLCVIAEEMQKVGVKVDVDYIRDLESKFTERKEELFPSHKEGKKVIFEGFNPRSGPQTIEYFAKQGISLKSTKKHDVQVILERLARKCGARDIEELENTESIPKVTEDLLKLYQYKAAGKGLKAWFDAKYIDSKTNLVHPRWIMTATSTGRTASSGPNFQNIPVRGFGAKVRNVIIPRSPGMKLLKCDASQMELRICLWAAGVEKKLGADAFIDLVKAADGKFDKAALIHGMTARDIAKSVCHGSNYGESFQVLTETDLRKETIAREIKAGARLVLEDWEYGGGVASYTGANLAERLFGGKSYEQRKAALEIQEIYSAAFPDIRAWQQRVSREIETQGFIKSSTGRYLELYGSPEDNLKVALAFTGQSGGADFMLEKMTRYYDELGILWLLFIHDETIQEIPIDWGAVEIRRQTEILRDDSRWLPGFNCPFVYKVGMNWGAMEKVNLERVENV